MLKKRVIPVILFRNGRIVQSRQFARYNIIGDPFSAVERISSWHSDELLYLDISEQEDHEPQDRGFEELLSSISTKCSVPLAFGGGIRTVMDARRRLRLGADKVTLNTAAIENAALISEIAGEFGSQAVVVSMDVKVNEAGRYEVYKCGRIPTGMSPEVFAKTIVARGAGEILLNSVDRDGTGLGFDLDLINLVCEAVPIPVVAMGGAGTWQHFADVLERTRASGVAAANIFQHLENSVYLCRDHLYKAGFPVRKPLPLSINSSPL